MADIHVRPDWNTGVTERITFRTNIFTTRSGKEVRRPRYREPRVSHEFTYLSRNRTALDIALLSRGIATMEIPDYTHPPGILSREAKAGDEAIYLDLKDFSYASSFWARRSFVLFDESQTIDLGTRVLFATSFSNAFSLGFGPGETRIALSTPLDRPWSKGTKLFPTVDGRLQFDQRLSMLTDKHAVMGVVFDLDPGIAFRQPNGVTLPTVAAGFPLLEVKPNWTTRPDITHVAKVETVDYGRGVARFYQHADYNPVMRQYLFEGKRAEVIEPIRKLFYDSKGKVAEFYMPTWTSDLVPLNGIPDGGNTITVEGTGLAAFFSTRTDLAYIMIETTKGGRIYRKVTAAATVAPTGVAFSGAFDLGFDDNIATKTGTRLTLSASITNGFPLSEIAKICWVPRVRFATDTIAVQWRTDTIGAIIVNVTTLEELPGEIP